MRTRIKFCGLTHPADLEAAAEAGADAIGFVFYPKSPRAVTAAQARGLIRRLPPYVTAVGLFVNASSEQILQTAEEAGLGEIQLHGDEPPEALEGLGLPVVRALRIPSAEGGDWQSLQERLIPFGRSFAPARALLFDADSSAYGGSGHTFDWAVLAGLVPGLGREGQWILSGGLTPQSVGEAIRQLRPPAVDVSSGIEQVVQGQVLKGRKDPSKMFEFAREVAAADRVLQDRQEI